MMYPDQEGRLDLYVRKNKDAIAAAISDGDGAMLSKIRLTGSWEGCEERKASLLDRGLARDDGGTISLSEAAEKAVSLYPLLGDGTRGETYPEHFHQMILSCLAFPSSQRHLRLSLTAAARLCFPSIGKEGAECLVSLTLDAFIALGIIRQERSSFMLERGSADRFLSLSLCSRMSYIIDSGEDEGRRKALVKTLSLLSEIAGLPDSELGNTLSMISRASGYDLPPQGMLEDLQLLCHMNGKAYGRRADRTGSSLVISSDFSVMASGRISIPLYLMADPVRSGIVSEWVLSKDSIRKAVQNGLTGKDIITLLKEHSGEALPDSVASRILSWEEMLSSARAERCIMLSLSERTSRIVAALMPELGEYVIAKPSPTLLLMDGRHARSWSAMLQEAGVDILGDIAEDDEGLPERTFMDEEPPALLPPRRPIAFDEELRRRLLEGADAYRRALVLSGFIYREDQDTPELEGIVLGLDYQEKRRMIADACAHGRKIYAEFVDGSVIISSVSRSETEGHVIMGGREIDIAKIWKTAQLPASVESVTLP